MEVALKNYSLAKDAYNELVKFATICNKTSDMKSQQLVRNNLHYYSGYSTNKWRVNYNKFILKLDQNY